MPRHRRKTPLTERFWPRVEKTATCWLWRGAIDPRGYGRIGLGGREDGVGLTHRVAWELTHGPIPDDTCVLHYCDVPTCVNPDHLYLGDRITNNADMREKGRHAHGENHKNARLSDADIVAIRTRWATSRVSGMTLAAEYGITRGYLYSIVQGRRRSSNSLS